MIVLVGIMIIYLWPDHSLGAELQENKVQHWRITKNNKQNKYRFNYNYALKQNFPHFALPFTPKF